LAAVAGSDIEIRIPTDVAVLLILVMVFVKVAGRISMAFGASILVVAEVHADEI